MKTIDSDLVRDGLDECIEILEALPVFPSLVWLWTWDCIKAAYPGDNLTEVWERFWEGAMDEGWTLEYGTDSMADHITDWLIKNDFLKEEE